MNGVRASEAGHGAVPSARARVPRLTGGDRMQWEADTGPFPLHIGAVLMLDPRAGDGAASGWADMVADRLGRVPALGRRPVRPARGAGWWVWRDDDRDPAAHVSVTTVADASDRALLDRAIAIAGHRFGPDRAPWSATVLADDGGRARAVVVVLHHALADGLSGLAVVGALADGVDLPPIPPPADPPTRAELVADAWARRLGLLRHLPAEVAALRAGLQEMGRRGRPAPRSSLNVPTGPRRDLAAVDVDLEVLRRAARAHRATVNDALLVAVAATLARMQRARGEELPEVVVSVPVAVTDDRTRAMVGNAVGAIPLAVPTVGPLRCRLRIVAARRRQRLSGEHGRSLPVVLAAFRVLSTLGLVGAFTTRQRLVTTFVTNVRGPDEALSIRGVPVRRIVPVVPTQGNQAVSFAALSYAGRLTVAVTADPDLGHSAAAVADVLREELGLLAGSVRLQRAGQASAARPD